MSRVKEEQHLEECIKVIKNNINKYTQQDAIMSADIKEMYDHYHDGDTEIYTALSNTTTMHESVKIALHKNRKALAKPYFGRIDYLDHEDGKDNSIYIGKHGVMRTNTEIEVVDWRAPISTIYYESQVGECSYQVSEREVHDVTLELKRTYVIEQSKLIDFYDSEVVANDELLTKYLAKNKEAVLGEIIATIQKEQNDIIRQTPYHSVIVQGVAGSGKTTVAMHRISYILYNYEEKFKPTEFYIIGSNRILLDYITSVLPDLDVYHVNQMTLEMFYLQLLDEDTIEKKYKIVTNASNMEDRNTDLAELKGSLTWTNALQEFLDELEKNTIPVKPVTFEDLTLFSEEAFYEFMRNNARLSTQAKINMLNERALIKIKNYFIGKEYEYDTDEKREIIKRYNNFYGPKKWKKPIINIYIEFIEWMKCRYHENMELISGFNELISSLGKKQLDVYDLATLMYIKKRVILTDEIEDAKHIVVDEAQDYGVMVFWVLKKIMPRCTFTIMGDVSQNINYDSGMNDWEAMKKYVFSADNDYFGVLAKSYRNTIEISNFASTILQHCSFETYQVEPIIRHGKDVAKIKVKNEKEQVLSAVNIINEWLKEGYDTIAVITKDEKEAEEVQKKLREHLDVKESSLETAVFQNGIMVLPIKLTKGLEFDTVLLWNPDEKSYPLCDANAKLLYVGATRALHELSILYQGNLSPLLL